MFDELDSVALTYPMPSEGLPVGARGVVVAVFGNHETYLVEFLDGARTLALTTVLPDRLRLLAKYHPSDSYAVAD